MGKLGAPEALNSEPFKAIRGSERFRVTAGMLVLSQVETWTCGKEDQGVVGCKVRSLKGLRKSPDLDVGAGDLNPGAPTCHAFMEPSPRPLSSSCLSFVCFNTVIIVCVHGACTGVLRCAGRVSENNFVELVVSFFHLYMGFLALANQVTKLV